MPAHLGALVHRVGLEKVSTRPEPRGPCGYQQLRAEGLPYPKAAVIAVRVRQTVGEVAYIGCVELPRSRESWVLN
jgi:hypothetical protein